MEITIFYKLPLLCSLFALSLVEHSFDSISYFWMGSKDLISSEINSFLLSARIAAIDLAVESISGQEINLAELRSIKGVS